VMVTAAGPERSPPHRTGSVPTRVPRFCGGRGMRRAARPFIRGAGRNARRSDVPKLLVNPRATVSYGADTLRFLRRGVRGAARHPVGRARALDQGGPRDLARHGWALAGTEALATGLGALLRPGGVGPSVPGASRLGGSGRGIRGDAHRAPFLVSFSGSIGDCQLRANDQPVALFRAPGLGGQAAPTRPPDERPTVLAGSSTRRPTPSR